MSNLLNVIRATVSGGGSIFSGSSASNSGDTAYDQGYAEGYASETRRLATILGNPSIKGDPGRMSAALELAANSPRLEAAGVVSFVVNNVGPAAPAMTYAERRLAAAGAAHDALASKGSSVIADAVARTNAKRGMASPTSTETGGGTFSQIVAQSVDASNSGRGR
jgi:hypothetical protein